MKTGVENGMFWSEIESGFGEPGGILLPRIPGHSKGDQKVQVAKEKCFIIDCDPVSENRNFLLHKTVNFVFIPRLSLHYLFNR